MTAAAAEFSVTHGAISRHITALEEFFGFPLLKRQHLSVEPTAEGARLAEGLTTAFSLIDASVEQLKPGPVTVSCSATIMMRWLIPRISLFHTKHPNVKVQLNMNCFNVDLVNCKINIAIMNNIALPPRDFVVYHTMIEWICPVCSPEYYDQQPFLTVSDLANAHLLRTKTRPQAWAEWAEAAGVAAPDVTSQEAYEHFYLLIQAALCGLGVAVVPTMLVADEIRFGRLVAPLGFVAGPRHLALWIAPHLSARPDTRAMADWLAAEFTQTADLCAALGAPRPPVPWRA
jgi:DNA-binding transcriptional LysR family regulator